MSPTIQLLDHEPVTFKQARSKDFNVIHRHNHIALALKLYTSLWSERDTIASIVRAQLGLEDEANCLVTFPQEWIRGKFNVCVPVEVHSRQFTGKLIMRCPLPFAVAETMYPGTIEEKLRGEIGAYVWMQQNCADIRIPRLYGFSIASRHFVHEAQLPWYSRILRVMKRWLLSILPYPSLSHSPTPSRYAPKHISAQLPTQYMLLEYIGPDTGEMLSKTWAAQRNDQSRRKRLFSGLARIIVSLSRVPQPRIGSFEFHDDCTVTLTNRPAFAATALLENCGAKRSIPVRRTYSSTEPFISDMITLHDNYFYGNQSAVDDEHDCRNQMAVRALLRTISHHYIRNECRDGPFLPQLTDLHQSNIFVDKDWEVTCLLDLEWLCALPPEALSAPYWLTGQDISELVDNDESQNLTEYNSVRQEFMQALKEEESKTRLAWPLTSIMEDMWQSSGTWFWCSLKSDNGAYYLLNSHLCPRFSSDLFGNIVGVFSNFWREGADQTIAKKVADFAQYEQDLGRLFEGPA
ncbi:hypothetical protein E4U42_007356 [Claviceps africana]|uniref:Aminoglycoside phosphotransferase domain-containing protein n=1 Tax=Claviceps africana TaxID=83212 RepID=A0A8K0NG87_9HYPO|nr:hypothetical protein E4U42_007356 [Claviceps africana]